MVKFWKGFEKRAQMISRNHAQGSRPLKRTISTGGPRLDQVTVESDRAKFRMFKG